MVVLAEWQFATDSRACAPPPHFYPVVLQMAERQALRGSEAMSFLLTYNGGRLHADLMARLRALPADEARAIRHLASLREVWPLLNDLYGVDSMWHKMRLLDDTLGEYKVPTAPQLTNCHGGSPPPSVPAAPHHPACV